MDGFAGFHATAFTQPFVCPSRVSINEPFSMCHIYTFESRGRDRISNVPIKQIPTLQRHHTLASAEDQFLVRPAKRAPDDTFPLLLPGEFSHNDGRFDIDHVYFVIGHVDQHISRVPANAQGGHVGFQLKSILFLSCHEVVHIYLPSNR